ncbi:hypothetical protein [Stenotrophomonas phage CM2]
MEKIGSELQEWAPVIEMMQRLTAEQQQDELKVVGETCRQCW